MGDIPVRKIKRSMRRLIADTPIVDAKFGGTLHEKKIPESRIEETLAEYITSDTPEGTCMQVRDVAHQALLRKGFNPRDHLGQPSDAYRKEVEAYGCWNIAAGLPIYFAWKCFNRIR